ncbi:MAG: hypothetical protein CO189_04990 [candidate division Zixibacteria bacterium CG_4_9_14_3_um_filter_46_8]|nr:MAG: hypothetical protein CO189_04990 [candidate division Zixibacteria bacterium CG_4_9_14_3_um_filter_46_8]
MMNRDYVFDRIGAEGKVSTLPHTLSEILMALRKSTTSADELANIIKRDVSLTAKILRAANSPFYRRAKEISTVSSAVILLGSRAVQALALSVSIYDLFKEKDSKQLGLKEFWKHSLEIAILGRMLAEKSNYPVPEEAFVCGLLHDAGILILEKVFPELYCRIIDESRKGACLHICEKETFDCTHAEVISFLAEKWNFPEAISMALVNHHTLPSNTNGAGVQLDSILYVAEAISNLSFELPLETVIANRRDCAKIMGSFGIEEDITELSAQRLDDVIEAARFLDIDIGSPFELVSAANEQLYKLYVALDNLFHEQIVLQQRLISDEKRKTALKSLGIVLATLSHYINNSTASILGRAQLLGMALSSGEVIDEYGTAKDAVDIIQKSVDNITAVLEELSDLKDFDTIPYFENSRIIDIERKVRHRLQELEWQK